MSENERSRPGRGVAGIAALIAVLGCGPAASLRAVVFQELCSFPGACTNASASLVRGDDGAFYGTTYGGGGGRFGSVYKLAPNGAVTLLASFSKTNGANPRGNLLKADDGSFYGTTYAGGVSNLGTVFRVTTNGALTSLASFMRVNGAYPQGALVQGPDGALYGTTLQGEDGVSGAGTIFRFATNGQLTTLGSFNYPEGGELFGNLIFSNDGALYGAAYFAPSNAPGMIYRVTTNGSMSTVFQFSSDNLDLGGYPYGGLLPGSDGLLYGTTQLGGPSSRGTIFSLTTNGVHNRLFAFGATNGGDPQANLIQARDGKLYGTSAWDSKGYGTVFRITTNGLFNTLLFFNGTNGSTPLAPLFQASDGAFYGTASVGGSQGGGNVFRLSLVIQWQSITRQPNGWKLTFTGTPGDTYRLMRSPTVNGPWTFLTNVAPLGDGTGQYIDPDLASSRMFYRLELTP